MKRFCVSTLTCNDRDTLKGTFTAVLSNTRVSDPLEWFLLLQGCTPQYVAEIAGFLEESLSAVYTFQHAVYRKGIRAPEKLWVKQNGQETKQEEEKPATSTKPVIRVGMYVVEQNLGLSKGNNLLCDLVKEYEYVLNVEDDWTLLPEKMTQCPPTWLTTCLTFLDANRDVSTLFLRKYATAQEKWQYGWTRVISYRDHQYRNQNFNWAAKIKGSDVKMCGDLKFQHIPTFLFTFNPAIRRNADYYKANVFPLNEFEDVNRRRNEWKQTQEDTIVKWGWCESLAMEKHRDLKTYNVQSGCFGHYEDWAPLLLTSK